MGESQPLHGDGTQVFPEGQPVPLLRIPEFGLTEEQHEIRSRAIGSSEVASLFGKNPLQSYWELWMTKAGKLPKEDLSDNDAVFWGGLLEERIAQGAAIKTGWQLSPCEQTFVHPKIEGLVATPDLFVLDHEDGLGILEIKNIGEWSYRNTWDGSKKPSVSYQLQMQTQLACVPEAKWAAIFALTGGTKHAGPIRYERHEDVIAKIEESVEEFWRSIESGDAPDPDYVKDADALKRYEPTEPKTIERDDPELVECASRYREMTKVQSQCRKEKKEKKARLLAELAKGDATEMRLPGFVVSNGGRFSLRETD